MWYDVLPAHACRPVPVGGGGRRGEGGGPGRGSWYSAWGPGKGVDSATPVTALRCAAPALSLCVPLRLLCQPGPDRPLLPPRLPPLPTPPPLPPSPLPYPQQGSRPHRVLRSGRPRRRGAGAWRGAERRGAEREGFAIRECVLIERHYSMNRRGGEDREGGRARSPGDRCLNTCDHSLSSFPPIIQYDACYLSIQVHDYYRLLARLEGQAKLPLPTGGEQKRDGGRPRSHSHLGSHSAMWVTLLPPVALTPPPPPQPLLPSIRVSVQAVVRLAPPPVTHAWRNGRKSFFPSFVLVRAGGDAANDAGYLTLRRLEAWLGEPVGGGKGLPRTFQEARAVAIAVVQSSRRSPVWRGGAVQTLDAPGAQPRSPLSSLGPPPGDLAHADARPSLLLSEVQRCC
jgi:hypothetical protein